MPQKIYEKLFAQEYMKRKFHGGDNMSRKEIYVCDHCGKEIPVIKKKDMFGIEREYLQSGHLEALHSVGKNLSMFGIDFCKDCAHKIDIEIMEWKMSVLNK